MKKTTVNRNNEKKMDMYTTKAVETMDEKTSEELAAELEVKKVAKEKETKQWILTLDKSSRYQLLTGMKADCDYYLNGHNNAVHLWAEDETQHIECMLLLWNSFDDRDKPRWLSKEQIIEYGEKMGVDISKL